MNTARAGRARQPKACLAPPNLKRDSPPLGWRKVKRDCPSLGFGEPDALERRPHALGAHPRVLLCAVHHDVGVLRHLVRGADAGEVLELAGPGTRVEALGVALLGDL